MVRLVLVVSSLVFLAGAGFAQADTVSVDSRGTESIFEELKREKLPLTPQQIREYRRELKATQKAVHEDTTPMSYSRSLTFVPEPGGGPVLLKIAPKYISNLAFFDRTGEPWPVQTYAEGQGKWFRVSSMGGENQRSHILVIASLMYGASSNLSVKLLGLPTPLVIRLQSSEDVSHELTHVMIPRRGPNAKTDPIQGGKQSPETDPVMQQFLDHVPPESAQYMMLKPDIEAKVWKYKDHYYVRTKLTLISPGWTNMEQGAGGLRVYRIPVISSIRVSLDGELYSVSVTEFGVDTDE